MNQVNATRRLAKARPVVANCDDNCAGLSDTAKTPESEEPVGPAQTTGCDRSKDIVMFVRERGRS
jgi:hypothetical protein